MIKISKVTLAITLVLGMAMMVPTIAMGADIDIKPGKCPNPFPLKSYGKLPVALLGADGFDVTNVNMNTLVLTRDGFGQVSPTDFVSIEDITSPQGVVPCACAPDKIPDTYPDLLLKFPRQEIALALGLDQELGANVLLKLEGQLLDGTPFSGEDCVWVKKLLAEAKLDPKGKAKLKSDEFGSTSVKVKIKNLDPAVTYSAFIRTDDCSNSVDEISLPPLSVDLDGFGLSQTVTPLAVAIDLATWYVYVEGSDGSSFCGLVELKKKPKR